VTSILTNGSAISALQTLRTISDSLHNTQQKVATGLRVGAASDNAAYWSIATTMRSDNGALSAVQDALGLGAAKVDTAYAGMEGVVDVISEMKAKIVVASESGVDREKVQLEIGQLKDQLSSIVASASFNGVNWLSTDVADASNNKTSVVAAISRGASGNFGVQSIMVDLGEIALFNKAGGGLLQKAPTAEINSADYGGFENLTTPVDTFTYSGSLRMYDGDEFQFDVEHGGTLVTATVTKAFFELWTGGDGVINTSSDWWNLVAQATIDAGLGIWGIGGASSFQGFVGSSPTPVLFSNFQIVSTHTPPDYRIMDVDVTSEEDLGALLSRVDGWLEETIKAAANLGALSKRISMQESFVDRLADSVSRGVGRLVDADMNEESTRLKALQTQQQLATQSLSIANTSADNVLSLFR